MVAHGYHTGIFLRMAKIFTFSVLPEGDILLSVRVRDRVHPQWMKVGRVSAAFSARRFCGESSWKTPVSCCRVPPLAGLWEDQYARYLNFLYVNGQRTQGELARRNALPRLRRFEISRCSFQRAIRQKDTCVKLFLQA